MISQLQTQTQDLEVIQEVVQQLQWERAQHRVVKSEIGKLAEIRRDVVALLRSNGKSIRWPTRFIERANG